MARATKKASASRTSRSTSARAKASKPAKKNVSKAGASKKPAAKAASSKKPVAKKAPAKKSPAKKLVKQVTGTRKAGKTTVSAKKVAAKTGKQGTATKATAKPVKTAAKPAVKPAATPTKAEAPPVKAPAKAPKKQEPPVVETAPKKPRKRELTSREVQQIRAQLEEQKENFLREYNELEEGSFTVSQSEMSGEVSFDEEYADAGTFTFEREKELSIGNNIRDLLDRVNAAINAIDAGTYGFCENCGDPINKARLLALPYTTLCIRCKQLEERSR